MDAPVAQLDKVFVVRFLETPSLGIAPERWRARIEYVNTRQEFATDSLARAFMLIRSLLLTEERGERLGS